MKKGIFFVAMVALCVSSGAWAQEQKTPKALDAGQYAFDVGGKRFTIVSVRDNNTWRHDQSTMYAIESNGREYYKNDAGKIRVRVAEPKMVAHDTASSSGLVKQAVAGFVSNIPTAAGIGFGLRFQNVQSPDQVQVNQPVNVKNTGVNKPVNAQSQFQTQTGPTTTVAPVNVNANTFLPTNTFNPTNKVANQNGSILSSISQ